MSLFTDITLGQYYAGESLIHRLDPRTKLIAVMVFMTSMLLTLEPLVLLLFSVLTASVVALSKLPGKLVFGNLRPFIWLFALTMLVHVFWTEGQTLFTVPWIRTAVTQEGLELGLVYSFRLGLLVVLAAILTLSTSPIELTDAMERLFAPLKKLRVPTHEIVMMLTLSLRFIPTLLEEAQRVRNAQVSRGASFEGGLLKKVKGIIPLILPLFISAFRRADDLALAMDSRCYAGGEQRTSYRKLHFRVPDYIAFSVSGLIFIFILLIH